MAGKYVLSLVTAALIGGIVTGFFPDGSFRRLLRLLCGVFLLTVVLAPVSALEMPDLDSWLAGLDMDAWDAVQQGEDYVALRRREGICERLEAYTLDKAAALGADVSARFTLDVSFRARRRFIAVRVGYSKNIINPSRWSSSRWRWMTTNVDGI